MDGNRNTDEITAGCAQLQQQIILYVKNIILTL